MQMTHIDLFAGIGGFSLGFERAGIETLAHVEIDNRCQSVLRNHWPNHIIHSDVCEVGKDNLPYADIITYGSPCQDLSIAGKRKGIHEGTRSNLFFEAARIIREVEPKYAIWENVPGAMFSNNGRDFQSVLECLLDASVPMPRSGRWASAGMVRIGQKEIAWRILDAQFFGVAQRRRRLFLVFCPRGDSAAEVLFEREGVRWDPPQGREAGKEIAAFTTSGFADYRDGVGTLRSEGGDLSGGSETLVAFDIHQNDDKRKDRPEGGLYVNETDKSLTLQTGQGKSKTVILNDQGGSQMSVSHDVTATLRSQEHGRAPLVMAHGQANAEITEDMSPTLNVNHEQPIVWHNKQSAGEVRVQDDISPTMSSTWGTGGNNVLMVGVRRLTPVECERLQGFPDGWTDGQADSARYRQLGNAVAVPVVEWIARRIAQII